MFLCIKRRSGKDNEYREGSLPLGICQDWRSLQCNACGHCRVTSQEIQNKTDSIILRDEEFTQEILQTHIESSEYPIVHIAILISQMILLNPLNNYATFYID